MIIELKELYQKQKKLDERIHIEHSLNYQVTRHSRILALIVELGELANETRCFKYWSNKPASKKEVILDEFADGLHFFLSLGIDLGCELDFIDINEVNSNLTDQFLKIYGDVTKLYQEYNKSNYEIAFTSFLSILKIMGYSENDLIEAYNNKLKINYIRQDNHY